MPRSEQQIPKLKALESIQKNNEIDSNHFAQIPAYENKVKETDMSMQPGTYTNTENKIENNTSFQKNTQQENTLPPLLSEHREKDPFDIDKPKFYMRPPDPINREKMVLPDYDDSYDQGDNLPEGNIGIDRIESMLDILEKRIRNQDFKDLNVIYRRIYDLFNTSDYMSPNEKRIIAERINTIFSKAKRIYTMGNVVI